MSNKFEINIDWSITEVVIDNLKYFIETEGLKEHLKAFHDNNVKEYLNNFSQ